MTQPLHIAEEALAKARAVETWLFDLDNTLYPPSCRLFDQVSEKIVVYVERFLGIEREEALRLRRQYFLEHGTTMKGMMSQHGMEPEPFLDFVHDIDISGVKANGRLDAALRKLPGRKIIFTNADVPHSERILDRLGIRHHFEDIYDIVAADYHPKPDKSAYEKLMQRHGLRSQDCAFIEDTLKNLAPAHDMGMHTVWIADEEEAAQRLGPDRHFVHHRHHEVTDWLEALLKGL